MPNFYDQYACWAEETVWGTPVARTIFSRYHPGSVLRHIIDQAAHTPIGRADVERMFIQQERGEGKLILPAAYSGLGKLFKHAFGVYAVSGAGPFTHTFTLGDGPPFNAGATANAQGLSVELHAALPDAGPLQSWLLEGAMVNSLKLAFAARQEVMADIDLIGERVTQVIKTASPVYADLDLYLVKPSQVTLSVDAGAWATVVPSVEVTLNNNLVPREVLGSQYIGQPYRGPNTRREITGAIKGFWETAQTPTSKTVYDKFIAKTAAAIIVTATGPTNYSWTLTLNNVRFTGETPEPQMGGVQEVNLPFTALFDATLGAARLVESNQTATY
jgi:hypothetical protein